MKLAVRASVLLLLAPLGVTETTDAEDMRTRFNGTGTGVTLALTRSHKGGRALRTRLHQQHQRGSNKSSNKSSSKENSSKGSGKSKGSSQGKGSGKGSGCELGPLSDPQVLEDVSLPHFIGLGPCQQNLFAEEGLEEVKKFLDTTAVKWYGSVFGKPKPLKDDIVEEPSNLAQQETIDTYIKQNASDPDPVDGYLYFGNNRFSKILPLLCKTNPFWASALTATDDSKYLELIAYKAGQPSSNDSMYLKLMRLLKQQETSHRINVRFNTNMTVNQISIFDQWGERTIVPGEEWDYYASGAIYNMMYYSSTIHSLIHILHYLMTHAIIYSTQHDASLAAWSSQYHHNIAFKYRQVAQFGVHSNLSEDDAALPQEKKVISGELGFGASIAVIEPMRDLLVIWGHCKTADDFVNKFLLRGLPKDLAKNADVLSKFNKHVRNIEPFAEELAAAMKKSDPAALKATERALKKFMSNTGKGVSKIDSMSSWVQLMSCTGIVHGTTLSFTRLMSIPEVLRWRNITEEKFDAIDARFLSIFMGTMVGIIEDRHVFSSEMNIPPFVWNTESFDPKVIAVIEKYHSMADAFKNEYEEAIIATDDFREYGWILSDYCSDGFDGKQHTISAYL